MRLMYVGKKFIKGFEITAHLKSIEKVAKKFQFWHKLQTKQRNKQNVESLKVKDIKVATNLKNRSPESKDPKNFNKPREPRRNAIKRNWRNKRK